MDWKQTKLQSSYEMAAVVQAVKNGVIYTVGGLGWEQICNIGETLEGIFDF